MKITIINGSPRKNGATFKVLNLFKELLENINSGINVEFINLIDSDIKYCIGCQHCYKTGKCIISGDSVEEIHETIKNSNGVIFGSPTYASNVTGLFKNFHDRVHMTMEQLLYRKPCINITTFENAMGNKTLGIMKEIAINAGGYNAGSIAIRNTFNKDPINDKIKDKIKKLASKLINRIQINEPPMASKIYTKIAVSIFLKPFVFRNKEHNQGIINSWIERQIIK